MDTTKFNFLPAAYDTIAYTHSGQHTISGGIFSYEVVYTNGVGFFLPVILISLDGEEWFNADYPPRNQFGQSTASAYVTVFQDRFSISGFREPDGILYWKVLGLRI